MSCSFHLTPFGTACCDKHWCCGPGYQLVGPTSHKYWVDVQLRQVDFGSHLSVTYAPLTPLESCLVRTGCAVAIVLGSISFF